MQNRVDTAAKIIHASPGALYNAFLDPISVSQWRPPQGMECHVYSLEPCTGGHFKMAFIYKDAEHSVQGKTSEHEDLVEGTFAELSPGRKIVEAVNFKSDDPAFAGTMMITTTFTPVVNGTEVRFTCEHVPPGIRPEDHQMGMQSSLENLSKFVE